MLSCLKQSLSGCNRADTVFQHYQQTGPMGETHGCEALRRLGLELSIESVLEPRPAIASSQQEPDLRPVTAGMRHKARSGL